MTNQATIQIIEQLKDSSHPPIVLLDGDWGIGKTYLVNKEVRQLVNSEDEYFGAFHYLSVFGIKSVIDFQDQVISLYISNLKESSSYFIELTKLSGKLSKLFGADDNKVGAVQGLISGVSGLARQQLIEKMKGFTLVVDDLERLTDESLISDIMGSCLRLAEQNKIKIITIANESEFKNRSKIEKTFTDVIKMTRSPNEIIELVSEIYADKLDSNSKKIIHKTLEYAHERKLSISNLRVLQRCINRILKIEDRIKEIEDINLEFSQNSLIQEIILITLFSYTKKLSLNDFINLYEREKTFYLHCFGNTEDEDSLSNEELKEKKLCEDLSSIFHSSNYNLRTLIYCFTNVIPELEDEELIEEFGLIRLTRPLDLIKRGDFYSFQSESDFEEAVRQLEDLIFNEKNIKYSTWVRCCDTYFTMIEKGYLDDRDSKETLKKIIDKTLDYKYINLEKIDEENFHFSSKSYSDTCNSEEWKNAIRFLKARHDERKRNEVIEEFSRHFTDTMTKHHRLIDHNAFLNFIDPADLSEKIISWPNSEIRNFLSFIDERYKVSNEQEKDRLEKPFLEELNHKIQIMLEEVTGRLKKGILKELNIELEEVIKQINSRQEQ